MSHALKTKHAHTYTCTHNIYMHTWTGLCRTCEVFGVAEMVVENLSVLEDREFQSLSVTAEKWLGISEVCMMCECMCAPGGDKALDLLCIGESSCDSKIPFWKT